MCVVVSSDFAAIAADNGVLTKAKIYAHRQNKCDATVVALLLKLCSVTVG